MVVTLHTLTTSCRKWFCWVWQIRTHCITHLRVHIFYFLRKIIYAFLDSRKMLTLAFYQGLSEIYRALHDDDLHWALYFCTCGLVVLIKLQGQQRWRDETESCAVLTSDNFWSSRVQTLYDLLCVDSCSEVLQMQKWRPSPPGGSPGLSNVPSFN